MTKKEKIKAVVESTNDQLTLTNISYKREPKKDAPAVKVKEKDYEKQEMSDFKQRSYINFPPKNAKGTKIRVNNTANSETKDPQMADYRESSRKRLPKKDGAPKMGEKKYIIDATTQDDRCTLNKK